MAQVHQVNQQQLCSHTSHLPANCTIKKTDNLTQKLSPKNSKFEPTTLEKLKDLGHNIKLFQGIKTEALFLPEKGCHLEILRSKEGSVISIDSVKNHFFYSNDGKFHIHGIKHGFRLSLYDNGNIATKSFWINDKENGHSTSFYIDGSKRTAVNVTNGKRNGIRMHWDALGNPLPPTYWKNGKQQFLK